MPQAPLPRSRTQQSGNQSEGELTTRVRREPRPPLVLLLPDRFLRRALILGVRGYQIVLGPILGGHCRFTPTCSTYAIDALRFLPSWKAVPAILWRIARCQPLCKGGFDFVDPKPSDLKWRLPEAR